MQRAFVLDLISRIAPMEVLLTKEALDYVTDASSLDAVISMEDRQQVLCTQSNNFREGLTAFLRKSQPGYTRK